LVTNIKKISFKLNEDDDFSGTEKLIQSTPSSVILSGKEELVNQISSTIISGSSSLQVKCR
jgi:hypothetical protein